MPTYTYACRDCDERLEVVRSFSDDPLTECPTCHGSLRQVFKPAGIVFKGSGWHIKDYAPSGGNGRDGGKGGDGGASSDSGGSSGGASGETSSNGSGSTTGSSSSGTSTASTTSGSSSGSSSTSRSSSSD